VTRWSFFSSSEGPHAALTKAAETSSTTATHLGNGWLWVGGLKLRFFLISTTVPPANAATSCWKRGCLKGNRLLAFGLCGP
jgi:hypothetical protein